MRPDSACAAVSGALLHVGKTSALISARIIDQQKRLQCIFMGL
jgi:hypothetical protein